jgi:hypothetical protein
MLSAPAIAEVSRIAQEHLGSELEMAFLVCHVMQNTRGVSR